MGRLNYHYHLRLGDGLEYKDLMEIKKKLNSNPLEAGLYLITISANEKEQLDIFDAKYLIQKYYDKRKPYVIGITKEKAHAINIVSELMDECVKERGDANLREYLIGK